MARIDELVRVRSEIVRFMMAEFFGTFLLVFVAHSTGAAYSLTGGDPAAKTMGITFGVGLAAYIALATAIPVSGGHINPAITVALASWGHFPWSRVGQYLIAQYLGGFVAGLCVFVTFYDPIKDTHQALQLASGNSTLGLTRTRSMFASYPAPHASIFGSLFSSFWATALFLIGIAAILDPRNKTPKWFWPFGVAFVLMISLAAFGGNGGPSVNPAADLAPRLFSSIAGWGKVAFDSQNYQYWWTCGLLGPHLGAIFGLWIYRLLISAHVVDPEPDRDSAEMEHLGKA